MSSASENNSTRQLWLVPVGGTGRRERVADVAVQGPARALVSCSLPGALAPVCRPGSLVRLVLRGRREVEGLCVRVSEGAWDQTRPVLVDARPPAIELADDLARLGEWLADYFVCSAWTALRTIVPAVLRKARTRRAVFIRRSAEEAPQGLSASRAAVLAALRGGEMERGELLKQAGAAPGALAALRKLGLIATETRRVARETVFAEGPPVSAEQALPAAAEDGFALTDGQRAALDAIGAAAEFRVLLLFGVPGSGKTEVYVRAIRQVVRSGRQAIFIIPEIALATQLVERLSRRFGRTAILHSQISETARRDTLARIASGGADVVIGTRSAVFAPCPALGLIVVDEEQEGSLKNLAAPYYHARDVAIMRARLRGVPVVLGSATPALETWYNAAHQPHDVLLRLPERVPGAVLPTVRLAAAPRPGDGDGQILAPVVALRLRETVAGGAQAIVLHNRRGYAAFLRCVACGLAARCERCGAHYVLHQAERMLKCHRCGQRRDLPGHCLDDSCRGRLVRSGLAIQALEEELGRLLPGVRLLRLDSDTMRRRGDYEAALRRFEAGEADVLLGTQMVAKGLDFPRVRFVAVIDADAALALPDFRAAERVFQLIVQVVGRAGRRDGESLAIIQAEQVGAPAIRHALGMDYESFVDAELNVRRRLRLPPFYRLARIVLSDARPGRAAEEAARLTTALRRLGERVNARVRVDDAAPCAVERMGEMRRWQILIRAPRGVGVQGLLRSAADSGLLWPKTARRRIDVDPLEML